MGRRVIPRIFHRIVHQVIDQVGKMDLISFDQVIGGIEHQVHFTALAFQLQGKIIHHIPDDLMDIDRF